MTDTITLPRSVVERALEMLNRINAADEDRDFLTEDDAVCTIMAIDELDAAIRAALDQQQVEQEPVAWAISHSMGLEFSSNYPMQKTKEAAEEMSRRHMGAMVVRPLYAAPVRTKDLTDDEIHKAFYSKNTGLINWIRAVIAADREKNNANNNS